MSARFFTSSSLSPVQSPRKNSRVVVDGSDEADEAEESMEDGPSTSDNEETGDATLGEDEFEVEAILARKGGYNGRTLMYKIRWVRFRQAVYTY